MGMPLSLNQALSSDAQVSLVNMAGQVVKSWQIGSGTNFLRMELANLPKGVYAVSLYSEKVKSVKKLIIQ